MSKKKPKTLEVKLRSAIRLIWSRSSERRAILKAATNEKNDIHPYPWFQCHICQKPYPIQMAEVDHEPPVGPLENWKDTSDFIERMFLGAQRAVCKICHKQKTALQRRKKK